MKKICLLLCLIIVGMIAPINTKAATAKCYYCPNDAVYKWTSNANDIKGCSAVNSIKTEDACNKENVATESDFIGNSTCGGTGFEFHQSLPKFTSTLYDLLKIATPVILIITGMLDMLKAVSAQKEDEIKKAQQKFVRRLLAGAIVFLVFVIVETVINTFVESTDAKGAMQCVNCFIHGGPCNN